MLRKLSLTDRYARETTLRSLLAGNQVGGGGGWQWFIATSHRYTQHNQPPYRVSGPLNTDAVWSLGFSVTGTFRIYVTAESLLDYSVSLQGSISRTSILVMVGKTGFPMIDACSQEKTNLNILMKLPVLFSLDETG